jgi:archaellum component FlaC
LKVDKVTLTRELSRARKKLSQAEADLLACRESLWEAQKNHDKRMADQAIRSELEASKEELDSCRKDIQELRNQQKAAKDQGEELESLKEYVEDLKYGLRESAREIDLKTDELVRQAPFKLPSAHVI